MSNRAAFERWLKARIDEQLHLGMRRLVEESEEDEEEDDDTSKSDDSEDAKLKKAVEDAKEEREDNRGGPQQATAAKRKIPAPDPDDLTISMIVDKLNAIRSGKSLKDSGVRARIADYFRDLTTAQRLALYAFLEGLAEVIAAEIPGDDARQPDDPDIGVGMDMSGSDDEPTTRVVKPGTKEYTGANRGQQDQQQNSRAKAKTSVPQRTADADDDSPVLVVQR